MAEVIDYRELLLKYIAHVGASEGTTFLGSYWGPQDYITPEEWDELQKLDEESAKYTR